MVNLTQKERSLLEDQKSHEEICIKKYGKYVQETQDPQLKQIFLDNQTKEQEHLNSINQLLNGQVPSLNQSQPSNQKSQQGMQAHNAENNYTSQGTMNNQKDADLCTDMLMTEKYVSGAYDTAIFEFRDPNIRQVLNHIQKEEQEHGESVFKYMESKGMYNPQQ